MENIIKVADSKKEVKQQFTDHKINIDNRTKINITGVDKVISASETQVLAKVSGTKLCILGKNLTVSRLDVEQGILDLTGELNSLKYTGTTSTQGFLKRIFK